MSNFMRKLVSKKKKRFISKEDGFNLDLTYITPRIIAMGFPSEGTEGVYRNPMPEVIRFLENRHKDHYKVYNLCSERSYDISKFHDRVGCFPFDDHNAPPITMFKPFCEDVDEWMKQDPANVCAIHCKAGKGRTGVMICAYLVYSRENKDASAILTEYGNARTKNGKGVTIPSQIRYVHYFADMLTKNLVYEEKVMFLKKVIIHTLPRTKGGLCNPFFVIRNKGNKTYKSKTAADVTPKSTFIEILAAGIQPVSGDVKIEVFHKDRLGKPVKMFHFWFNTFFVKKEELILRKEEVDKANKDKKHKVYDKSFTVEVQFARLTAEGDEVPGRPRSALFTSPGEAQSVKYEPPTPMQLLQEQMRLAGLTDENAQAVRSASSRSGLDDDIPPPDDENLSDDDDDDDNGGSD